MIKIDYAYTLQGWIKGVNSETLDEKRDMGKDGKAGTINQNFARDAFGYSLNYYAGDYSAIGGTNANNFMADTINFINFTEQAPKLYNGNIRSMVTAITTATGTIYTPWKDGKEVNSYDEEPYITLDPIVNPITKIGSNSNLKSPSLYTWHSHLNGKFDKNGKKALPRDLIDLNTFSNTKFPEWSDDPSDRDIRNKKDKSTIGIIMGTNDNKTTFYDGTGRSLSADFNVFYDYIEEGQRETMEKKSTK